MKLIKDRFSMDFSLLFIVLGGIWVRISGINEYYYNPDEIQFLIIAKGDTLAEVWRRGLAELHPPLAHFIRHYLLMITDEVFHQRLFSVAASLVSLLGMYRIGCLLRGKFLGLFCALCFAFFPVAVSTSITIRNYAFFMAFLSWAIFYFIRYQTREKRIDLFGFTLLLFLASATHFTGFLVGAACGLAQGCRLASTKRWQPLLLLSLSFLPLLALGLFFYVHYLAPGTAGPMWKELAISYGGAPRDLEESLHTTFIKMFCYFSPTWGISEQKTESDLFISIFSGLFLFYVYIKGLLKVRANDYSIYTLLIAIWCVATLASVINYYPFSVGRHSYYILPFFIIPIGYEIEYGLRNISFQKCGFYVFALLLLIGSVLYLIKDIYIKYFSEFPLKQKDFTDSQEFLNNRIKPKDVIAAGGFSAYCYFIYHKDKGKTPYDSYREVTYHHNTTLLAPYNPPFIPFYSLDFFRRNLLSNINSNITLPERKFWVIIYGWKNNIEYWHLLNCKTLKPLIHDYFSRDGVLIFSIQINILYNLLNDDTYWKECYSDYRPLISAQSFKSNPDHLKNN